MKKKILFITNIPSPYRVEFFREFGKYVDLTVLFEGKTADRYGVKFNWNQDRMENFRAIFLSEGDFIENRLNGKIFRYLKKGVYDEIIATNYSYRTEMAAIIYMKLHGIPYYMETDGGMVRSGENFIKRRFKRFLVSGAKGYFSPSAASDEYLCYYGAPADKIFRYPFTSLAQSDILHSVLTKEQKAEYREKLGMQEKRIILGVGQFIERKGFDLLLNACASLKNKEETGLYLVGGKPTEEYLALKEKVSPLQVHFVPFQPDEQVKFYYRAADIFVLPTREDVWGLVINEAMAQGLPVITTDRCGAGKALVENGKNGIIVKAGEAKPLSTALEEMFSRDLAAAGEESLRIIRNYTYENMAQTHARIFGALPEEEI